MKNKKAAFKKGFFFTVPGFWFRNMAKEQIFKVMFETKTSTPFNIQKGTVNRIQLMHHINWLYNKPFSSWS